MYSFGYHVLHLPPYHPDLNPIEEAWGIVKNHVSYENDGSSFQMVKEYIIEGINKANEAWPKLIKRTVENERGYIMQDKVSPIEVPASSLLILPK
jgi:transposase